jgi:sec-independent protein translocase protein TatA
LAFILYGKEILLFGLGTTELLVILAVVFFFFGAKKIPELSRGLGRAVRNFKKGLHEPDAIEVTPKKEEKRLDEKKEIQK